jgi:putative ABC transport system permease protein
MSQVSLLASNLLRKPTRTLLTIATLVVAFLLFMLLRAVAAAFAGGVGSQTVERLYIDARYSMTDNLPIAHARAVQEVPGVRSVTPVIWFGGYYQQPVHAFPKLVVDPHAYFDVFPEAQVDGEVLERFRAVRRAVVVAESIAEQFGWQPGDLIPIHGDIVPRQDGGWNWEFELAGTYALEPGSRVQPGFLIQREYFNESVPDWAMDMAYWMVARVESDANPQRVIEVIDGLFENSPDPTRSRREDDYARQFANQLGDMGAITSLILAAVFFTIILLTANVTSLSFRERVPELAVMKTIGFQDGFVGGLVMAEAVLICLLGAAGGVCLALLVAPVLNAQLGGVIGAFELRWIDALSALGLAALMGICIALPSARAAQNLPIVDALREVG